MRLSLYCCSHFEYFFQIAQSLHPIKSPQHHLLEMDLISFRSMREDFLSLLVIVSIQIHPDTANSCFSQIEMDLRSVRTELILPQGEGE